MNLTKKNHEKIEIAFNIKKEIPVKYTQNKKIILELCLK